MDEDLLRRLGLDQTSFANRLRNWLREVKAVDEPSADDVLTWDADTRSWRPKLAGGGVQIGGDLGGSETSPIVIGLQTVDIAATAPNNGDVLTYDAAAGAWKPAPPPSAPVITTLWTTLYEVDFRTLPNQAVGSGGNYANVTIDGQSFWYYHGGGSGNVATIVNGTGLNLQTGDIASSGLPYGGTTVGVRAYLIPGYDAAKKTMCQVRYAGAINSNVEYGAIHWSGPEVWGYGPGNNGDRCIRRITDTLFGGAASYAIWGVAVTDDASPAKEDYVFSVTAWPFIGGGATVSAQGDVRAGGVYHVASSAWPAPEDMVTVSARRTNSTAENANFKQGLYVGKQGGTGNQTATAIQMRILQKAA